MSAIDSLSKEKRILKHSPRFIILTDYQNLVARDLKLGRNLDIELEGLPKYFDFFLPLAGSEVYRASNDNEADRNASYKMATLYDLLREENPEIYSSKENIHHLNILLSRLLFCYFAEDTEIFEEESIFTNTLVQHTNSNGSDTHLFLEILFKRLNSREVDGFPNYLAKFPYVNGNLFKDSINIPIFSTKARKVLIELGNLNWKDINPDIFGSMIQAVVVDDYRSDLGMHYTSVENIKKLIRPLFLDELDKAFKKAENSINQLKKLIIRISKMKFFDPACGSGNFLIITYKEIRNLEIEILKREIELDQNKLFVESEISLSQFYGIEIDDFAYEIAILSLWLAEHQMNQYFEEQLMGYTEPKSIIPLKKSGTIIRGNATRLDWKKVCPINQDDEVYIIGNPPYLGARLQGKEQKEDMDFVFKGFKKYRDLDYINCWFLKGVKYISNFNVKMAFVSTNSICQGQQVALIWSYIFSRQIEIDFAYKSFRWTNNAKGNAGVIVTIIGLRNISNVSKHLLSIDKVEKIVKTTVKNINPYLIDAPNIIIIEKNKPLSKFPEMKFGNMPNDGGGLIFTEREKEQLVTQYPNSKKFIKIFLGSSEFIRGNKRYCLWIENENLNEAIQIPEIKKRIEITKKHRLKSKDKGTNKLSQRSHQFRDRNIAKESQLIIPSVSSERRKYIPCGYLGKDTIVSNLAQVIYDAEPFIFAIVTSHIHMVWMRTIGGKLGTSYRYSKNICYNTFPFPNISTKQKETLNLYTFDILDFSSRHFSKSPNSILSKTKANSPLLVSKFKNISDKCSNP